MTQLRGGCRRNLACWVILFMYSPPKLLLWLQFLGIGFFSASLCINMQVLDGFMSFTSCWPELFHAERNWSVQRHDFSALNFKSFWRAHHSYCLQGKILDGSIYLSLQNLLLWNKQIRLKWNRLLSYKQRNEKQKKNNEVCSVLLPWEHWHFRVAVKNSFIVWELNSIKNISNFRIIIISFFIYIIYLYFCIHYKYLHTCICTITMFWALLVERRDSELQNTSHVTLRDNYARSEQSGKLQ